MKRLRRYIESKGKQELIKSLVYICLVLVTVLPLVQVSGIIKVRPLKGAFVFAEKPEFKLESWLQGSYQTSFDAFFKDHIGFRPWFVRIHNQIQYSLYNKINANSVIRGKQEYLYDINYIKAYYGQDYIGSEAIQNKVERIKELQTSLEEMGKTFFICLAPGKASFYPEYIPEELKAQETDCTNYKQYCISFNQVGINYIDMNKWFVEMKDTCDCILYPRYGIHWSHYGALLAADSMISYIEIDRNIDMPDLQIGKMKKSSHLKYTDYDIGEALNLMFQLSSDPLCYPEFNWEVARDKTKPKTIVISDSFYWCQFNLGIGSSSFDLGGFWYYNNTIYPDAFSADTKTSMVNVYDKLQDTDVIILMASEVNLDDFCWSFIDMANRAIANNNPLNKSDK